MTTTNFTQKDPSIKFLVTLISFKYNVWYKNL